MATADFALLILSIVGVIALLSVGGVLPRLARWADGWRQERALQQERLRQEQLKTAVLEEQLRNEVLRDVSRPEPPPKVPER